MVPAFDPSTWETEAGRSLLSSELARSTNGFKDSQDYYRETVSKNQNNQTKTNKPSLLPTSKA